MPIRIDGTNLQRKVITNSIRLTEILMRAEIILDPGRYTAEYLTEWEQVENVSILVITKNKTTLCQ